MQDTRRPCLHNRSLPWDLGCLPWLVALFSSIFQLVWQGSESQIWADIHHSGAAKNIFRNVFEETLLLPQKSETGAVSGNRTWERPFEALATSAKRKAARSSMNFAFSEFLRWIVCDKVYGHGVSPADNQVGKCDDSTGPSLQMQMHGCMEDHWSIAGSW